MGRFVTGKVMPQYFADDFLFKDPDVSLTGIKEYCVGVRKIFDQSTARFGVINYLWSISYAGHSFEVRLLYALANITYAPQLSSWLVIAVRCGGVQDWLLFLPYLSSKRLLRLCARLRFFPFCLTTNTATVPVGRQG